MESDKFLDNEILKLFEKVTEHPEDVYVSSSKTNDIDSVVHGDLKTLVKTLYDWQVKSSTLFAKDAGLPELIVNGFGHDEIWAQLDLVNENLKENTVKGITDLLVSTKKIINDSYDGDDSSEKEEIEKVQEKDKKENPGDADSGISDQDAIEDDDGDNDEEDEEKEDEIENDDDEENEDEDEEGSIDLFAEGEDDDDAIDSIKYKDFFGDQPSNGNEDYPSDSENHPNDDKKNDNEKSAENYQWPKRGQKDKKHDVQDEELDEPKSEYEKVQERLQSKIGHLEDQNLSEKPWQLKGEVTGETRPKDSLLEEFVEYDVSARPTLVITEQTNRTLADIILHRVKNKAWDSVRRKEKPSVDSLLNYKKAMVLDDSKSKFSLAEIYEKEYLKQKEAQSDQVEVEDEKVTQQKHACSKMIDNLFAKLDGLSHFYFTPRMVKPEVKIVNNMPAINMEEVAPLTTTNASLLAPEEVTNKSKRDGGVLIDKSERTATDKNRAIRKRKKKLKARKELKEGTTKKEVLKGKNVTEMKDDGAHKALKSSQKFFAQLQENNTTVTDKNVKKRKNNVEKVNVKAKKLKL